MSQAMYSEQGLSHGYLDQGPCQFSINSNLAVKPSVKVKHKSDIQIPCCHCLPVTDSSANQFSSALAVLIL